MTKPPPIPLQYGDPELDALLYGEPPPMFSLEEVRSRPPFEPWGFEDFLRAPPTPWLIGNNDEPVLIARGLWCTFGLFKAGKTYLSILQAFCIATGTPFHGLPVTKGRVAYVCAEGDAGRIVARVVALCRAYKKDPREVLRPGALSLIMSPVNLIDGNTPIGYETLLAELQKDEGEYGPYVCVWLDTWAKMLATAGGHDSDPATVMPSIVGCELIRKALNCTVAIVAHVGVNEKAQDRPKGLSDLPGQVDGATKCEKVGDGKDAVFSFRAVIQRYAADGFQLQAKMVERQPDRFLRFITKREKAKIKLKGKLLQMLDLLRELGPGATVEAWRAKVLETITWTVQKGENKGEPISNPRAKWKEEFDKLKKAGWIRVGDDDRVTIDDGPPPFEDKDYVFEE